MISLTNYDFQWARSELVIIYPDICQLWSNIETQLINPSYITRSHPSFPSLQVAAPAELHTCKSICCTWNCRMWGKPVMFVGIYIYICGEYWDNDGIFIYIYIYIFIECGENQWCECWFINPMKTIVIWCYLRIINQFVTLELRAPT